MGVDSGLPDFRGNEGMWKEYPPLKNNNYGFMEISNPVSFVEVPELVWSFYGHRYDLYTDTIPHEGFNLLKNLIKDKNDYFIVTSNVDGQFQKAGFDIEKIYEIHGRIHKFQCTECDKEPWVEKNKKFNVNKKDMILKYEDLPLCECGKLARPNIMMFSDYSFNIKENNIQNRKYQNFLLKNRNKKILVIEIGAGTAIPTIRNIGEGLLKNFSNSNLIRINPRESFGPEGTISIPKGSLEALQELI